MRAYNVSAGSFLALLYSFSVSPLSSSFLLSHLLGAARWCGISRLFELRSFAEHCVLVSFLKIVFLHCFKSWYFLELFWPRFRYTLQTGACDRFAEWCRGHVGVFGKQRDSRVGHEDLASYFEKHLAQSSSSAKMPINSFDLVYSDPRERQAVCIHYKTWPRYWEYSRRPGERQKWKSTTFRDWVDQLLIEDSESRVCWQYK